MVLELSLFAQALGAVLAFAFAGWLVSVRRGDVSIVDSLWSIMILLALVVYAAASPALDSRATLVLVLAFLWGSRLSLFIAWRNWGKPEDHRYQAIRRNNEPGFRYKSPYIVFWLQAVLAVVVPVVSRR